MIGLTKEDTSSLDYGPYQVPRPSRWGSGCVRSTYEPEPMMQWVRVMMGMGFSFGNPRPKTLNPTLMQVPH